MSTLVVQIQTWAEIRADFAEYWYIYLSMPIVAAVIGYVTKLVFLEMLYRPLEYKGIGPLGWQGIVPRRAGKVAAVTIDLLTENILKPEELLDRIDARAAVEELREPLTAAADSMARELTEQVRPGMWDSLPEAARRAVLNRIHEQAPQIIDSLLQQMRANMNTVVDLQFLTVTTLVRNKQQLNDLMRRTGGSAMGFVRRSGIYFGFLIGLIQMAAWGALQAVWIMPVFGLITGFVSDWLALNMLFSPRERKRILGIFPFQGILQQRRDEITRDYCNIMAQDLFAPDVLFQAILTGPGADRLFAMVHREVSKAIDDQAGVAQPLVTLAVGTQRYRDLKQGIADRIIERLPQGSKELEEYAVKTLGIEELLQEKMSQLTAEEFEAIMRPVFKDDEWLMITVGAVLGFLVGELQVVMVEHLTTH